VMLLARNVPSIDLQNEDWSEELARALAMSGTVELYVMRTNEHALRRAIIWAIAHPIDVGFMQFFPIVERFERGEKVSRVTLTLREYV